MKRRYGTTTATLAAVLVAIVVALTGPAPPAASAAVTSRLTSDQILERARAGRPVTSILGEAFPSSRIGRADPARLRVLVADLAPSIIVAAHSRPRLVAGGKRIALAPGHRYEIARARPGWILRDLDAPTRTIRVRARTITIRPGNQHEGVLLVDPLGRRFRGELRFVAGERGTISLINVVGIEDWMLGAVAGEAPSAWMATPRAVEVAAVVARSRALAAADDDLPLWDITSDDPTYLGIDGERPGVPLAAARTRGRVLLERGVPLSGLIRVFGPTVDPFVPDPGRPRGVAMTPARPIPGAPQGLGPRAVQLATARIGTPYRWGGAAPGGFDCSGLVYWIYGRLGIGLPRVAEDQAMVGVPVDETALLPGDVVFFADSSGYVHHEGVYIGDGQMIHAPQTGETVRVERIDTGYYARQYAGARRFSPTVG